MKDKEDLGEGKHMKILEITMCEHLYGHFAVGMPCSNTLMIFASASCLYPLIGQVRYCGKLPQISTLGG